MKLKYGKFLKMNIQTDDYFWDSAPIGAHARVCRMMRENTASHQYYYIENGSTYVVSNPTAMEAMRARLSMGAMNKKIVGYLDSSCRVEDTKELAEVLASRRAATSMVRDKTNDGNEGM